ncbi:MAG TPA: 5-oxoprolinase subunit PxpA [Puia sp.]|nr:5-oxoprolinase subunit PxpA [Puia sp.]
MADLPPHFTVDLNCDMGEGMPGDGAIFPFISSANIACGGHAGDDATMRRSVELALEYGVAIGAHPSYPDRSGFGRIDIFDSLPLDTLLSDLKTQIASLQSICYAKGTRLHHVKPHGALYNRAARDPGASTVICEVVAAIDPSLIIYGLAGSQTRLAAQTAGLRFVNEVFADRTYRADGSLTPRSEPFALIHDPATMLNQVLTMVGRQQVRTSEGKTIPIIAETICLHGDGDDPVKFASIIRRALDQHEITVGAP